MLNFKKLASLFAIALAYTPESQAKLIQILHTNDLHASLETFGAPDVNENEYGGWAQLKQVMNQLTAQAKAKGMETIKLDAGDYTEGTSFYFSNHGKGVIRAFQDLGYDATAMGNHDWLMGADDMDALYSEVPFPFPVLSANVKIDRHLRSLRQQIVPSTQIVRDGIKFGILGLSTDEDLYSWIPRVASRKKDMKIVDYRDGLEPSNDEAGTRVVPGIANTEIQKLRRDNDVVIALTHIGYEEDKLIAANSDGGLDIVVGGHSHTFLPTATMIADKSGHQVPIVQTGFNGKCVGKIILDVEPGKRPTLVSYELVPVLKSSAQDAKIAADVKTLTSARQDEFGNRLGEVIGTSEDRLVSGDSGPTSFSKFVAAAMKDISGNVDFSLDVGAFHGNTPQPAGDVTRLNLMEMYPRKFEKNQNEGLYIYEADIPGILIKIGLKYVVRFGMYVEMNGVTYDLKQMNDQDFAAAKKGYAGKPQANLMSRFYPDNIRVNGVPVSNFGWYTLATSESLARGALAISPLIGLVIRRSHPTSHTIWDAMNYELLKIGKIEKISVPRGPSPWSSSTRVPVTFLNDMSDEVLRDFAAPALFHDSGAARANPGE